MTYLIDHGPELVACVFFVIFAVLFALVFLLYKSNRQANIKIADLESLVGVTADKLMSIKDKADAATYQEVIKRLKKGQKVVQIAEHVNISMSELEALEKIFKTTQKASTKLKLK